MGDMGIRAWWSGYGRSGKRHGVATLVVFMLGSAALLCTAGPTHAQINLGPQPSGEHTLCTHSDGALLIAIDDDCQTGITGIDFSSPSALTIGPAGSQTSFNASTGAATFTAPTTFGPGSSPTFNSSATFNNGFTASGGTFSGTVNMNGGFVVGGNQTVDMGNNRVQNVGNPTAGTDATNKNYVDG